MTRSPLSTAALTGLIDRLRAENGCPWDRQQTPRSMASYLTEEMYELIEAIEAKDPDHVCEELGDVLFHIFFIARLFQEQGDFSIDDVVAANIEKMTRRHPHVFGEKPLASSDEVRAQWHRIKMKEKNHADADSIIDTVPLKLPALMRAYRISSRVAGTGFDWDNLSQVLSKVREELAEFEAALAGSDPSRKAPDSAAAEFGDILLTLVNVARFARIHPETALMDATRKFEKRFRRLEKTVAAAGRRIDSLTTAEMDAYWNEAKAQEG